MSKQFRVIYANRDALEDLEDFLLLQLVNGVIEGGKF